ncbi:cyclic dehypoxanthinyl futalosine synthase [Desulfohalovibrio reitneri]|uniref:cyclic dehypoxanthinyl futalosine synthase n=1 Tax=Desulfohalovibrio reitneri TaxID=1307759 RepID=UPI0004A77FF2|nr:cyclic dehypoxanthinyl futalosine synthase [Desulfohalovibrio reitneri]
MPSNILREALERAEAGKRLDADQALALLQEADFHHLAALADQSRFRRHHGGLVTYVVDRNINYTNICVCSCRFCAYYKAPGQEGGYLLSQEELDRKIEETINLGGSQILMQGGHHPDLPLSWYEAMLRGIKERHAIHVHAFSPPEVVHWAGMEGISTLEVLARLKEAGLDSMPGGGAEILVDEVRSRIAPNKCPADDWLRVMAEAHSLGMRTTATMMFGHLETPAQRIEHMLRIREVQDRTGGFTAFIPWTFQPANTALPGCRPLTAPEYLRTLAVSRLVLDNVDNIQVSWVTMGPKVAQLALSYGANDFGSTMIEENVVKAAGVGYRLEEKTIRRLVRQAGFTPRRRLMDYSPAPEDYAEETGS